MDEQSIIVEDLVKKYGDFIALDHISFDVKSGEVFGLLGPNGAGKTTTIKILTGLTQPTSGKAIVSGLDVTQNPNEVKRRIGWISADVIVDDDLSAWENLELQGKLEGIKDWKDRAKQLLEYFGIFEFKDKQLGKFSTGMRKKVEISMALLNSPDVVFMDEPTIGLDVSTRKALWDIIKKINRDFGVTVLLTTHYMEEADMLCERIAIINKGKITAVGSPEDLKSRYGGDVIEIQFYGNFDPKVFEKYGAATIKENVIKIKVNNAESILVDMLKDLSQVKVKSLKIEKASLDTAFLNLTGNTIEEEDFDARKFYTVLRRSRK
ncbi:ATP-binding cassette domain-containing protein [Sulfuracidifex metallicus]|uniref:ATP-binding cassette domain-containing protein n=3 Tax=Sulfuracidifex metallicus TaxID=47303 RepID=A0A6A9QU88_SULME|nr:ATP-binding cassette domain-containing protein [Sulfuracidifex metallicus]MUN29383.1 ATP-binding cassette domain-containing protein [Sulfuracidifex metallicus DSM 6482 = JCM 9184]WOE50105.1 ATP-binding cassette domain-containing protein [Sulfuracidifex metallicus DSM 6482 = JCM 9184]